MLPEPLPEMDRRRFANDYVRSIVVDVLLTVFLCGLWNIWVQARQMKAVNFMLRQEKYSFWKWAGLTLITCTLWHIYHEYCLSRDIANLKGMPQSDKPLIHLVLSIFGLSVVVDALQQSEINEYFGGTTSLV